jgi:hypothetical protein
MGSSLKVIAHFQELRQGNFKEKIEATSRDEIGQVMGALIERASGSVKEIWPSGACDICLPICLSSRICFLTVCRYQPIAIGDKGSDFSRSVEHATRDPRRLSCEPARYLDAALQY